MREFKRIVDNGLINSNQSFVILLLIVSLSFSGFSQNEIQNNSESNSYNTILDELKATAFWFIDYPEVGNSKVNEYYKFEGAYLFEHYVMWENDDCYWVDLADSDNYSVRKNTKSELIIIINTGGDNFWEVRFIKVGQEFMHASNEYLNGELVESEKPLLRMIKAKNRPLNVCE